jgi:hypothetical protein
MQITRRRVLRRVALLLVLAAIAILTYRNDWAPAIVPPADNAYVGLTKQQIIARLGTPDSQCPGPYGNPPLQWAKQYMPCETLIYSKWDGTLYMSVCRKNGQWVCFCSNWLIKGGAF